MFLSLRRNLDGRLPGVFRSRSTTCQSWPSSMMIIPRRNSLYPTEAKARFLRDLLGPAEVLAGARVYLDQFPFADERRDRDFQARFQCRRLILGGRRGPLHRWFRLDD